MSMNYLFILPLKWKHSTNDLKHINWIKSSILTSEEKTIFLNDLFVFCRKIKVQAQGFQRSAGQLL